jgi:hypothetical protein
MIAHPIWKNQRAVAARKKQSCVKEHCIAEYAKQAESLCEWLIRLTFEATARGVGNYLRRAPSQFFQLFFPKLISFLQESVAFLLQAGSIHGGKRPFSL